MLGLCGHETCKQTLRKQMAAQASRHQPATTLDIGTRARNIIYQMLTLICRGPLVVLTAFRSGKSSLAFDTFMPKDSAVM